MKNITAADALKALETLAAYGRQSFNQEVQNTIELGMCVGSAIGSLVNTDLADLDESELCAALLEDGNMHVAAGVIRTLSGDTTQGTVTTEINDEGRAVSIQLSASYR